MALLWPLRPVGVAWVYENVGGVWLNRALLAPDRSDTERTALAERAGRAFQMALAWDPLADSAWYNLGTLYNVWGDWPSAERAWSRAATLNPDDPNERFAYAQVLARQGREEQAVPEWRAAGAAPYFVHQGLTLAARGEYEQAVETYRKALAIAPDYAAAYYYMGRALNDLGRREEALAALTAAAALEPPESPRRYLLQAEVYGAREEWPAALAALNRAITLSPQNPTPYYRMGWVLAYGMGDPAAAVDYLQWSLRLDPDYIPPALALARLYGDQGACDRAAEPLVALLTPDTDPALAGQAHIILGRCLLVAGADEADGLAHLERAVALNPASPSCYLTLAWGYLQLGRYHDAVGMYRRVLELDPQNRPARQALEELGWSEP